MAVDQQPGYWSAWVAPLPQLERRFAIPQLVEMASEASVALRGWSYPHVPREADAFTYRDDWVEARTSWERYQEVWRFHTNGLFTHRWRIREDGTAYRGTIHFIAAIYTIAEVWEFAKRLYGQDVNVQQIRVGLQLANVGGRQGSGDTSADLPYGMRARSDSFRFEAEVPRLDLLAGVQSHAVETSNRFFRELGFRGISERFVSDRTEEFLAGRR